MLAVRRARSAAAGLVTAAAVVGRVRLGGRASESCGENRARAGRSAGEGSEMAGRVAARDGDPVTSVATSAAAGVEAATVPRRSGRARLSARTGGDVGAAMLAGRSPSGVALPLSLPPLLALVRLGNADGGNSPVERRLELPLLLEPAEGVETEDGPRGESLAVAVSAGPTTAGEGMAGITVGVSACTDLASGAGGDFAPARMGDTGPNVGETSGL